MKRIALILGVILPVILVSAVEAQPVRAASSSASAAGEFEDIFGFTFWFEGAVALSPLDFGLYGKGVMQRSNRVSSVRGMVLGDAVSENIGRSNHYEEIAAMYGLATRPGRVHYALSAGFAAIRIAGADEQEPEFTTGIPVDFSVSYRPAPLFGFGLTGFANFNSVENVFGLALRVDIGMLR